MTGVEGSSTNGTYLPEQPGTHSAASVEDDNIVHRLLKVAPRHLLLDAILEYSPRGSCTHLLELNENLHERILGSWRPFEPSNTVTLFSMLRFNNRRSTTEISSVDFCHIVGE